jgi:hypothetical protein
MKQSRVLSDKNPDTAIFRMHPLMPLDHAQLQALALNNHVMWGESVSETLVKLYVLMWLAAPDFVQFSHHKRSKIFTISCLLNCTGSGTEENIWA